MVFSCEAGFKTLSKIGPISKTRPASSKPTRAISVTDARDLPPVRQDISQQACNRTRRTDLATVPSFFAPAATEVAMRVELDSTCEFLRRRSLPHLLPPSESARSSSRNGAAKTSAGYLFRTIPVHNFHLESSPSQPLAYLLGDHHRPVLPARTSKADRQVALALANVMRQQIHQQVRNAIDELFRLRKRSYVLGPPADLFPLRRAKLTAQNEDSAENARRIPGPRRPARRIYSQSSRTTPVSSAGFPSVA